jgi:hypothetical protein
MGVEKLSLGGLTKSLDQNPQISPIGATVSQVGTRKTGTVSVNSRFLSSR